MVGALHVVAHDPAHRQRGSPMQAHVPNGGELGLRPLALQAIDAEVDAVDMDPVGLVPGDLLGVTDGVPAVLAKGQHLLEILLTALLGGWPLPLHAKLVRRLVVAFGIHSVLHAQGLRNAYALRGPQELLLRARLPLIGKLPLGHLGPPAPARSVPQAQGDRRHEAVGSRRNAADEEGQKPRGRGAPRRPGHCSFDEAQAYRGPLWLCSTISPSVRARRRSRGGQPSPAL
mmetsp:Transcript_41855/g.102601  ORF Transcript_41855/g.102601 Transcript_41855/m.102601 type:complete len:230 (-) Transcript_41855:83-772(-)